MSHKPTTELVVQAWLKTIPGLPADQIGTNLPADPAKFPNGFVQILGVGGSPDIDIPMRRPVVSLDFWAAPTAGSKAPWGKANGLAEIVRDATYAHNVHRTVTVGPGDYAGARVLSVYPVSEPRRITGDPAGYARYSMDMAFHWTVLELAQ